MTTPPGGYVVPWAWDCARRIEVTALESTPDAPEGKTRVEASWNGQALKEFYLDVDVRICSSADLKTAIELMATSQIADALRDAS